VEVDDVVTSLVFWAIPVVIVAGLFGRLTWMWRLGVRCWERVHPTPPATGNVSVEQLAADLRRLAGHLERAYRVDQPSKMERLTAAALAYDWVLLSACRTLDVTPPGEAPLASVERLEVEAALAARGLDW
jgi:hypothetical protein